MEIRVLKYFLAIARKGSISGAAEYLHVTQPTLSRQMQELEEELQTQLFIRGNRNITLTNEGMLLLKRAEEIVNLADKTAADFASSESMISGDIYIGAGETDAIRLIAKVAKKLQADYPHISYHMFSGNAEDVADRLDTGLLDFGVLIEPADIKKYNYIRLPITDSWGLLMRKDSPLAEKKVITPDDVIPLPLICSRQRLVRNEISGWLGQDFEKLNIITTYNLVFNASIMVEEGMGYALCLDKLINTTGVSNLCFRPLQPALEANLDIVWKKHQILSSAAREFLKRLQNEL